MVLFAVLPSSGLCTQNFATVFFETYYLSKYYVFMSFTHS